jgi:putative tryptophan/tyrosine transport system substrate-binding protein
VKRREFIAGLGSAVAWPAVVRAQQASPMPVIGFLHQQTAETTTQLVTAFRAGLETTGFSEGRNVAIEYRWAAGHNDRLPALAADLVRRQVAAIATQGDSPAFALKAATMTIPIISSFASDPVRNGFVATLSRPSRNITGVYRFGSEIEPKRLELLCEATPNVRVVDMLVNPDGAITAASSRDVEAAARLLGRQIRTNTARNDTEIGAVFTSLSKLRAGALLIMGDSFFTSRSRQLGELAAHYAIPAIGLNREFALAGGLMSYSPSLSESMRIVGVYSGRILRGEKAADLPVQQATRIEMTLNAKAAKALSLAVPESILLRADEVIE